MNCFVHFGGRTSIKSVAPLVRAFGVRQMKKSLVALAVAAATSAASAQTSSVTLFGVVDVGMSRYSTKSAWYNNNGDPSLQPPAGQGYSVKDSRTEMSQGNVQTSRIGFRGIEDLGGGLSAGFWLEGQINPKDGARPLNFNRRSTVSLSGAAGELRLGRDIAATHWNDSVFDPLLGVGAGISLVNSVFQNLAAVRGAVTAINPGVIGLGGSDTYIRTSNTVGYFLPPNLGGVYGQFQYSFPENGTSPGASGGIGRKGRYVGARLGYMSGPLNVAAAYGQSTAADFIGAAPASGGLGARTDNTIRSANLGASYDFGVLKLFGEVAFAHDHLDAAPSAVGGVAQPGVSGKDKYRAGLLGLSVPFGVSEIRVAYSVVDLKGGIRSTDPNVSTPARDGKVEKLAVGYVYNLSKRTLLYATAAHIRLQNGEASPSVLGARAGGSPTYVSTGGGAAGYAPRSATGYDLGMRHAF